MNLRSCAHYALAGIAWIVISLLLPGVLCQTAYGQIPIRPTIVDSGDVSKVQPARVDRSQVGNIRATRPEFSVLVILTEPKNAQISINGKAAGKAVNGRFMKELPARKQYKIGVAAGPDYEEFDEVVTLKPREPAIVEAPLLSRFGTVRIFPAKDGVTILDNDKPVPAGRLAVDKENRIVLGGLPPGKHEMTYDLSGYLIYRRTFDITPGSELIWNFVPERAVVALTVVTDPKTAVYVDGNQIGTTPADGTLKSVVELGPHEVKLVKEDYEEYTRTLQFKYGEQVRAEQRLVPLPTSAEFSDDFDVPKPDLWAMPPSGASFKAQRLELQNARAVAYPTNIRYRDFEMNFHLQLKNAGGAAWAVRLKDAGNYYLFYLSGPAGLVPNRFFTYIVRNNEFEAAKPVRSDPVIARLVAGGQYEIHIKATGSRIEHQITPAETGKRENLGFFDDPNSTFRYGGIGFRTVASETFSVDELVVRPR